MKRPRSEGYGGFLLHDMRREETGAEKPGFPLNRAPWRDAPILVARRNFGSGSSREAAVDALVDAGIRVVVAPTFGDIFASNAVKNGLLPAVVGEAEAEDLLQVLTARPDCQLRVDLKACTLSWDNHTVSFEIDPVWREQLLNGWDDIDVTRVFSQEITQFKTMTELERPWMKPGRDPRGSSQLGRLF